MTIAQQCDTDYRAKKGTRLGVGRGPCEDEVERVGSMQWSSQQSPVCQRRKGTKQKRSETEEDRREGKEGEEMGGQRRSLTFKG